MDTGDINPDGTIAADSVKFQVPVFVKSDKKGFINTDDKDEKKENSISKKSEFSEKKEKRKTHRTENKKITKSFDEKSGCLSMAASNTVIIGIIVVSLIILCTWFFTNENAVGVYLGDRFIGNIAEKEITPEELLNTAIAKLKNEKGINLEVNETIALKPVHASKNDIVSIDYALSEICNSMTYQVEAFCINVGGKEMAVLGSEEFANSVLDQIKQMYVPEGATVSSFDFVPEVTVSSKFVSSDDILKPETALSLLTQTSNEPKIYAVQSGDTLSKIASDNDMSMQDIIDINDDIEDLNTILKIGQEINLVVPVPVVSVKANVTQTEIVPIPRDYKYVDNNNEYMTYSKVITNGADGEKEVTYNVAYLNGYPNGEKQIVSEKVIKEPITEVVERGTLQEPPKRAMGSFKYPTSGRLTSGFGARWGTTHKGIDLAASYGTHIYASDGGVVKQAGYNSGGYGYLVVIDHGNGYETYYGHNSSVAVSVGQKVAQGELIAYMGSTGNSTGNHCHFEIRKNGVPQNPLNYL